jgi:O-antigen ligase
MSALRIALPAGGVTSGRIGSQLGWAAAAGCLALVQAAAIFLDTRLGVGVAVALSGMVFVLMRPQRLVPIALVCVFLEGVTFNDVAVTRFLAPAALLLVLFETLRGAARIQFSPPLLWVTAYLGWAFMSSLWTHAIDGTRYYLQSAVIAVVFMFVFATLLNTEHQLRRLLIVLAVVSGVEGILSMLAFSGGVDEIAGFAVVQAGRGQGLVGDPDFFAAMQLVALPLILVLANEAKSPAVRVLLIGALFCAIGSVFTSLSRGAFLATLVLVVLLVWSRPERLFQSRRQKAIALLIATFGMFLFFSRPYVRESVQTRAESIYAPKNKDEASGAGRTNLWKAAEHTAGEYPLTGVGIGSFSYISEDLLLRTPGVDPLLLRDRKEGDNFVAHNTYLGTAAELGITGLLLYLGLLISTALNLRKTAVRAHAIGAHFLGRVAHALMLGLVAWSCCTVFLSAETARMFWIIIGLSLALPKLVPARPPPREVPEPPTGYGARSYAPAS